MPQEILNIIFSAVGVLVTGLITWLTTQLIAFLNSKIKNEKAAKFAVDVSTIVMNSVKTIMQTYVESLKQEGAFTEEKQKEALVKCLDIVKTQLTPELTTYIKENFGDIEEYLRTLIEAAIYSLKNK